jgi:hypothetical protein
LYVCRPTPRTWRALPRLAQRADPRIYTHGVQSLEANTEAISAAAVDALLAPLTTEGDFEPIVLVGRRWAGTTGERFTVADALSGGVTSRDNPALVAADLADDPGPWLLRLLLAVNAHSMTILIPNNHPDVATGSALVDLRDLVAAKYVLKVRRSTPDGRSAVIEARAAPPIDPGDSAAEMLTQYLLLRSRAKVGNVWRDALVSLNRRSGRILTKNQARALVRNPSPDSALLETPLAQLPRHQVVTVLGAVRFGAAEALALSEPLPDPA